MVKKGENRLPVRRVDIQVSAFTILIVLFSTLCVFTVGYRITYSDMIDSLRERVSSLHASLDETLDKTTFETINTREDAGLDSYREMQQLLHLAKNTAGVRYLYTAKENAAGELIYVVDGLDPEASDFRYPGDPIEPEIRDDMALALSGVSVLPDRIKTTDWGKIFISYLPIHEGDRVVGVMGIEFAADHQYNTYLMLRILTPLVITLFCLLSVVFAVIFFRRISNPLFRDLSNTDQLTQLKNRNAFEVDIRNMAAGNTARLGIVSLDLNRLKAVNDTLGHSAGDRYIQRAARAIQSACGSEAAAYRIGGDEFAVILPQGSAQAAQAFIARVQKEFGQLREDWEIETSLAAGYALYDPEGGDDLQAALRRADAAMYEHKRRQAE